MRALLFHGYLLRGTGSNIYTANLAAALARLGHEVHLLCQDRSAAVEGVRIHVPDIGGLLPVYVKDPYEGFRVKAFPELSEAELDRYVEANVSAVRGVVERFGAPDVALAGHLVMGPAILARAGIERFAAKIHGSALEYTVKPHPRFLPHAEEGMRAATGVLVGSRHTAESLWAALPSVPGLREKTRLGPPGVDTELFRPQARPAAGRGRSPRVVFVGKLIVSKGVDLLLAAWPLVRAAHPEARLQIAGFGEYETALRRLLAALDRGDLDEAREIARLGRELEGGRGRSSSRLARRTTTSRCEGGGRAPLRILAAFLDDPPPGYLRAAAGIAGSVEFLGRLEHDEVARLLPGAESLVMPSTFPEAFGMVAAEAAACGVLPVSAGHSGMLEVSRRLAAELPEQAAELTSFTVGEGAVEAIADRLDRWLRLEEGRREEARDALVSTARRLWSWEGVARGAIAASLGELDRLPLA